MRILLCSTYYGFPTADPDSYSYGGMERITWFLGRELVKRGHAVTLVGGKGTALDGAEIINYTSSDTSELIQWIRENKGKWDILHDMSHEFPMSKQLQNDLPCMTTMENPNPPYDAPNVVCPSKFHAEYTKGNWGKSCRVVYNAVGADRYRMYFHKEDYVAFIGCMESRKGALESIWASQQADVPIKMAGLKSRDASYQKSLDNLIDGKKVTYLGMVSGQAKADFMGRARAIMLWVRWPEPGSLAGVEAMAFGTPLVVSNEGCVKEYIVEGRTGTLETSFDKLGDAIKRVWNLSPRDCRDRFEQNFTAEIMGRQYEMLYKQVLDGQGW